jgi:hypothetical protein
MYKYVLFVFLISIIPINTTHAQNVEPGCKLVGVQGTSNGVFRAYWHFNPNQCSKPYQARVGLCVWAPFETNNKSCVEVGPGGQVNQSKWVYTLKHAKGPGPCYGVSGHYQKTDGSYDYYRPAFFTTRALLYSSKGLRFWGSTESFTDQIEVRYLFSGPRATQVSHAYLDIRYQNRLLKTVQLPLHTYDACSSGFTPATGYRGNYPSYHITPGIYAKNATVLGTLRVKYYDGSSEVLGTKYWLVNKCNNGNSCPDL